MAIGDGGLFNRRRCFIQSISLLFLLSIQSCSIDCMCTYSIEAQIEEKTRWVKFNLILFVNRFHVILVIALSSAINGDSCSESIRIR